MPGQIEEIEQWLSLVHQSRLLNWQSKMTKITPETNGQLTLKI